MVVVGGAGTEEEAVTKEAMRRTKEPLKLCFVNCMFGAFGVYSCVRQLSDGSTLQQRRLLLGLAKPSYCPSARVP